MSSAVVASASTSTVGVASFDSSLYCNSCGISLDSAASRGAHYRSEWHRYNLKRRCAGMNAIAERNFNEQLQSLQERKQTQLQLTSVRKCELCQSSFNSLSAFQIHLKSKKHLKRETYKRERTNSEKATENDKEDEVEEKEEQLQQLEESNASPSSTSTSTNTADAQPSSSSTSTLTSALRQVRFADSDSKADGDNDEPEEEEFTGEPIIPGVCLFCPTDFDTDYSACLSHMLKRHGFFVPFLDRLKDVEGFLTYLGAKIGAGNFCIYCLARFPDQAAVQQHMNAKNHCKIRLDDEEDEEEIMEFFEFENEKSDGKDGENSAQSTKDKISRRPVSVNSMGELLMSDGSIIGTRDLKRYYKQNLRTTSSSVAALPAAESNSESANSSSGDSLQRVDSANQSVVLKSVHPRQLHGRALESKYLRKLQRVALRANLAANKQKHFRKSTP